jgi:hypothetical protein
MKKYLGLLKVERIILILIQVKGNIKRREIKNF